MPGWYVSRRGEVEGPLSTEEVCERLNARRLAFFDLVFEAEVPGAVWRAIAQVSEFNKISLDKSIGSWVVLRNPGEPSARQDGPFTTAAVLEFLALGKLRYSDSVWCAEHQSWRRVGDVAELKSEALRDRIVPIHQSLPESVPHMPDAARLLENVMRLKKELLTPEPPPPETDGVDLLNPNPESRFGTVWALLVAALSGPLLAASTAFAVDTAAPIAPSTPGARVLEIVPVKLASTNPQLVLRSNAAPHDLIEVRLRAKTGEILKYASFDKLLRVSRGAGEAVTLDLAVLGAPPGSYQVDAKFGELKASASIFVGTKDQAFEQQLERHQKTISERQQAEKKALFYSAQSLEAVARKLIVATARVAAPSQEVASGWKSEIKKARAPILEFLASPRHDMAYPDDLYAIDAAAKNLEETAKNLDLSVGQKRAVASDQSDRLMREITKLRESASRLSSR